LYHPAQMRPPWARLALPILVILVVLGFLSSMLASTGGRFVPQVVDLLVVCQYARAMAEGHPFRYNPGEGPSTGSTSLLYTAWLGGAHALGIRGEGLVAFAIASGVLLFAASVFLARRIGTTLGGEGAGVLAGALLALGGPLAWSYLYGSDIALFMFLALLLLDRWLALWGGGKAHGFAVAGSLLALARPEGLWIGALLGGASLRRPGARRDGAWLPTLPAVTGVLVLALNRMVTGAWLGTSVADKSLLANYGLRDAIALVSEYAVDVLRGLLLGFYPSQSPLGFSRGWAPFYFPPLALVFIVFAVLRAPEPHKDALRWWLAAVGLVCLLVSGNVFMGVHFNRYLMWAFPGLLVLAAVGLRFAAGLAASDPAFERGIFRAGAGLFLALGLLSTARFAALYGEMAGSVARRDLALAEWIRQSLPPGVAMANLATSVEYLTGHRGLNLHGVTTPAFFGNRTAEREAGMFESLGRLPEAERPRYFISSASLQEGSALLKELVAGPPLFQTVSFSDELLVFNLRYDLVGKNRRLFAPETLAAVSGLREVDRLNVCDSADERRHGYAFSSHLGDVRLFGAVRIDAYALAGGSEVVADAGRAILGSETFRVRAERGRDLVVVLRTAPGLEVATRQASLTGLLPLEFPEAGFLAQVGNGSLPPVTFRPHSGWNEIVLRVPGALLSEAETEVHLKGRYASFQYWFFQ